MKIISQKPEAWAKLENNSLVSKSCDFHPTS